MEICDDRGCSGPPKLPSPKSGPPTKGQAGDGPELAEQPLAPGTQGIECSAEMELEKVRMEFELTRLQYLHQESERQRQHEEVMEQLRQQAAPRLVGDREGGSSSGPTEGQGLTAGVKGASVSEARPTCFTAAPHPGPELALIAPLERPC